MPHCSSENEEQLESMVGGASASQPEFNQVNEFDVNDERGGYTSNTINIVSRKRKRANNMVNVDFKDTLDKIRSFQIEFPQDTVVQGCGDESLCVFTDRWISLNEFNKVYRPAQKDKVDETELMNAIDVMVKKISPGEVQISIRNILASIILQSPNEESLKLNKTSQKCAIINLASVAARASAAALDITASIVSKISKHFEVEELQGLLNNMVDKWEASVVIIKDKLAELNLGELVLGTTKNIIQLLIQTKLIGVAYQLAHYLTCNNNSHIRVFAGYAMILLLMRCLKELIKKATPSDKNIQELKETMNGFVSSRNKDIKTILNDLNKNLPASQILQKTQELRTSIETGKTGNAVSDAYIDAAVNVCTALERSLNKINTVSKSAVDLENLENIKSMLMKITTGWNEINQLPNREEEEELRKKVEELKKEAEGLKQAADEGSHEKAQALEANAQALEARAEERPLKRQKKTRGGAPKRTKKVKSKMLKGKSKKHLKKPKKSKKTGKKVRFHSSSKKSKKTTRKKR